ncbi:MAG: hypothetical protein EXR11_10685 [Rhodospirillaceae bacterium]|nr:hypothetical protein [Rhodospirillaceae bacterium]
MDSESKDYPRPPEERPSDFAADKLFGGKLLNEMPPDWRVYAREVLDWQLDKFRGKINRNSEPVYRFLSFANAGGIALMIGMVPSFLDYKLSTLPLMFAAITFTLGMILLGIRLVIDLHLDTHVCQNLINDTRSV